ncbi:hypothetical protein CA13_47760 [Planctomycetes bacterium CA13]|uniref:DUF423 domain-containing protein n=1 Tax=Novipirellula herctigrandis TaxID=2527986 RepID=A0A5C5Z910_9BACT|nr:hypothetical protein CA13_47760 [Planctomycetes bacterium CA13]
MNVTTASRQILLLAAVFGALGVLVGAFGAHVLGGFLEDQGLTAETIAKREDQFDVGVRYHLVHAVTLLALAAIPFGPEALKRKIAWMFVVGLMLFCGSLYLLVLTNQTKLGMVTPIGGVIWIVAWASLARLVIVSNQDSA